MIHMRRGGDEQTVYGIVGHCPRCGAPVYGPQRITEGVCPGVVYSCKCERS